MMNYDVIDDAFLKGRPLSYSSLKEFRKSPKHYLEYLISVKVATDAMMLGSITEKLLLYDMDEFQKEYLVYTLSASKASNAGKAEFQELVEHARTNKKTLITRELYERAQMVVAALRASKELAPFLEEIVRRRTVLKWTDKTTNLPIVGYTDWDAKVGGQLYVCDLKVTNNGDPEQFMKTAFNYDYTIQVGAYLEGFKNTKYAFPEFLFVVAESEPPFNVSLMHVDGDYKEYCIREFKGTLKAFRYCMNNNLFSQGYEFRLMNLMPFFSLNKPAWGKPRFGDYSDE